MFIHYVANENGVWKNEFVVEKGEPEYILVEGPSIALDTRVIPHIVWAYPTIVDNEYCYDIHYSVKTDIGWFSEKVTDTPYENEMPGTGHFFVIDTQDYGHLVYSAEDDYGVYQVYYAKSKHPLTVAEHPVVAKPFYLDIRGSTMNFSLPNASSIRLDLFDACGRSVCCIASGIYAAGEHSIPINQAELPAGVYFVQGEIAGRSASAKFVLTK